MYEDIDNLIDMTDEEIEQAYLDWEDNINYQIEDMGGKSMRAGDLEAITMVASLYPKVLPHLLTIYKLGYSQGEIDTLKGRINRIENVDGINYGSEMHPSN